MIFHNARQAVHDAFATNVTSPNPDERGGTRYDSTAKNAHDAEAGLIIKAALEQRPHLRAMCVYLNAPDGFTSQTDIAALRSKLWRDIAIKHKQEMPLMDQSHIVAMMDYILYDFRVRTHNPSTDRGFQSSALAKILRTSEQRIAPLVADMKSILQKYDEQSLKPVWKEVNKQREKYARAYEKTG